MISGGICVPGKKDCSFQENKNVRPSLFVNDVDLKNAERGCLSFQYFVNKELYQAECSSTSGHFGSLFRLADLLRMSESFYSSAEGSSNTAGKRHKNKDNTWRCGEFYLLI